MERNTPKKVVVSRAAVKKAGMRSTKASAKLENRVVPAGYVRSASVSKFLTARQTHKY